MGKPQVFISYAWQGEREKIAREVEVRLKEKGLNIIRDQGNLEQVTGTELIKVLKPMPKIVILSACHSARKEPDLMPVARSLYDAGIETVIGMKKAVSHKAHRFQRGIF
jgi:hypothetical protein